MFHFDLDDLIMPDNINDHNDIKFVSGEPLQPYNRPNKYRILSKESRNLVVAAVQRGDDAEAITTTFQTSVRQVKKIFSKLYDVGNEQRNKTGRKSKK
jgi:hypothetical protein